MAKPNRNPFRIYQRGEIWHAYISATANGRRIVVRTSTGCRDKDAAVEYCVRRLHEITTAPDITHEITLDAAAARWLIEVGQHQAQIQSRQYILKRLLSEMNPDGLLSEITKSDISQFIAGCRARGRSAATINRYLAALSALFSRARDFWDCRIPNFRLLQFKQKEPVENIKYFNDMATIQRIVDAAPDYLKPIILTAVYTGLRLGRILTLKWDQVDFDNSQIVFVGKNGKNQSVPMVAPLVELLHGIERRGDFVFTNDGRPVRKIWDAWKLAQERAGVPYLNFHALRHTTATWLLRDSGDLRLVQTILGHKTIAITAKYAHLVNGRAAEGLNHLFSDGQ